MGYPVYNSDDRARALQTHDQSLIREMVQLLGDEILDNDAINRAKVAEMVFNRPELLKQLNALVHPRVKADFGNWVAQQQSELIFKESALLVETGGHLQCDAVIFVQAPEDLRVARVTQRDGISAAQVRARMQRQMSDAEKQAASTHIVINNDRQLLIPQVETLIDSLRQLPSK